MIAEARFFKRVEVTTAGCWQWTGAINPTGYSYFFLDGKMRYGHRVSYEWFVGPIPHGLDLDHLCRNRACVCPDHLEAVTRQINLRRSALTLTTAHAEDRDCGFDGCRNCQRFRWAS